MRPVGFSVLLVAFQPMEDMPFRFGVHEAAAWEDLQCGERERLTVRTQDAGGDNQFNRARHKMTEALELMADHPRSVSLSGCALDIGAAPGGWSYTLACLDAVTEVVAVDPADLNPAVSNHPKVVHIPQMMQEALPCLLATHAGSVAVASCDANREVPSSFDIVDSRTPDFDSPVLTP
jgi:23S rRNA U2552 (ribose-2'-O)-methylase RlmE/FtsJ